jgi:hypothetical protein
MADEQMLVLEESIFKPIVPECAGYSEIAEQWKILSQRRPRN